MRSPYGGMRRHFFLGVVCFLMLVSIAEPRKLFRPFNHTIPAVFVFGDSTVDSGNNNYFNTIFRSNFQPYGVDFPDHIPTGRFTDGRLITDFIASYAGIKDNVPPYLDPKLTHKDLMTGVSFASAGSGFDDFTTNFLRVIPMKKQIEYFREYKTKIAAKIGVEKTSDLVKNAAFIVSAGTNDIIISYYSMKFRNSSMDISTYLDLLAGNAKEFLQDLRKEGARNIAMVGVSKIGCVPLIVTISPSVNGKRSCNESVSSVAAEFNQKLLKVVEPMKKNPNFRFVYADLYKPLENIIDNPSKFGFENVTAGCCGTGLLEITFLCNPITKYCSNPSKYAFFDSVHPSEATYKHIFKQLRPTIDDAIKKFSH